MVVVVEAVIGQWWMWWYQSSGERRGKSRQGKEMFTVERKVNWAEYKREEKMEFKEDEGGSEGKVDEGKLK